MKGSPSKRRREKGKERSSPTALEAQQAAREGEGEGGKGRGRKGEESIPPSVPLVFQATLPAALLNEIHPSTLCLYPNVRAPPQSGSIHTLEVRLQAARGVDRREGERGERIR